MLFLEISFYPRKKNSPFTGCQTPLDPLSFLFYKFLRKKTALSPAVKPLFSSLLPFYRLLRK